MAGLSSDLQNRCHRVLLDCSEFDDHASLQTLFVRTELTAYRHRLPQASDKHKRVSQTILFLLDRYLYDGRPVFPVFLKALCDQYNPQDAQYLKLDEIRSEVERELGAIEFIEIPVVVVVMTHDEANDLIAETIFDDLAVAPIERTRFQEFREALQEQGCDIADLLPNYGKYRDNWKPHTYPQGTIGEIISDIAGDINQCRREIPGLQPIQPQFSSIDFFDQDRARRVQAWYQLGLSGCILIVDIVSLFHPVLRQRLLQSAMSSNERVAMLFLSPVNSRAIRLNRFIERVISSQMQLAFSRFDKQLDKLCEIGVEDLRTLQRWLFAILPEAAMIVQNQRPNPLNRRFIRERMGEPVGLDQLIFGPRGG